MARSMPQAGKVIGVSEPQGTRFPAFGVHQASSQNIMQFLLNFPESV